MKIKTILLMALFFLAGMFMFSGERIVVLPQLVNPKYMIIDKDQVIISDYPYLYLYSLKDFRLKRKVGGAGQGPGEFYIPQENMNLKERGLVTRLCDNIISTSSAGRVSYFKRNGDFIRLTRIPYNLNSKFFFLCDKLLGFIPSNGRLFVVLFDSNMENKKKILEYDYWLNFQSEKMENFFDRAGDTLLSAVLEDRIFLIRSDSQQLAVDVFDFDGKKISIIKRDVERIKIPGSFKERIHKHFQVKFRFKDSDYFIKNLNLPEYYPAVRSICTADGKLYIITFKESAGLTEVLVLNSSGHLLKKIHVPIKERNPEQLSPFTFSNGVLYQLIENETDENWELFRAPIKPN